MGLFCLAAAARGSAVLWRRGVAAFQRRAWFTDCWGACLLTVEAPLPLLPGALGPLGPYGPRWANSSMVVAAGWHSGGCRCRLLGTAAVLAASLAAVGWIPSFSLVLWWSWRAVVGASLLWRRLWLASRRWWPSVVPILVVQLDIEVNAQARRNPFFL
jgi:hypothetical protein